MSTQTSLSELQTAIYQKLTADSMMMGFIAGIFDEGAVPQNQMFPYVTIGDAVELPQNTFGRRGYGVTMMLHLWGQGRGFAELYAILARQNKLLDQQPLSLTTQMHIYTMYDQCISQNDPDGITHHLACRYKFFSQE